MRSKLLIYIVPVLLTMFLIYGYTTTDDPRNDAAPQSGFQTDYNYTGGPLTPDTATPPGFTYPKLWGWVYSGIPNVSAGTVGACYLNGKYYMNRWNLATNYRFNDNGPGGGPGTMADSNTAYNGGTGAIRDMTVAPDGSGRTYLWGGAAGTALYKMDTLLNRVATYTHAGAVYRAIAWDPNRKGFWSSNFSDNIVCRDTNGTVIRTITATSIAGKYGLAFDSTSTQDSAFLWVWSQNFTNPADTTNDLVKISLASGLPVRTYNFNKGSNIAGGAETYVKDGKFILALNFQNYANAAYVLKDLTPPPVGGNTLVLVHDSTITSTTQRKADRDTLNRYLPMYVGNYTLKNIDTSITNLGDLSTYNTVILQETGFDAANVRYLGAQARAQLKTWLQSGTTSNKKTLISIGADQGWNYSRAGSPSQDLELSATLGKYTYKLDNAPGTTSPSVTGVTIDVGNTRPLTSAPPGGSYWPDGCGFAGDGIALYKYQNHTVSDTLAAIGALGANYVMATVFQDPRYFTGGFGEVLKAVVGWCVANGGVITGTGSNNIASIPGEYTLAQNYPNPFNPTTNIKYSIPTSGIVSLNIYDVSGREVAKLVNEFKTAGEYTVQFNGANLSSGTYFYRIQSDNFVMTKKMMLIK